MSDISEILCLRGQQIDAFVERHIASLNDAPPRLIESILYSFNAGGKRLRPAMILETFYSFHPNPGPESLQTALATASAMELIHTFSLVHDDLPAMDDDKLRRGKPTNHVAFDEATAILAGDAMLSMAFEIIARYSEADIIPLLIHTLAVATGPTGMIGGQSLDLQNENNKLSFEQLKNIHRKKTGALLTASCTLGAICAHAESTHVQRITEFGNHLGLAFQIMDDILDETSTPQHMGKATQKDRNMGKNTYPALLGLEGAHLEANKQLDLAMQILLSLDINSDRLKNLANFVVARTK